MVRKLTDLQIGMIIAHKKSDKSNREVGVLLGIGRNRVNLVWQRYCDDNEIGRRLGSGRRKKTTPYEDRRIISLVVRNRNITADQI